MQAEGFLGPILNGSAQDYGLNPGHQVLDMRNHQGVLLDRDPTGSLYRLLNVSAFISGVIRLDDFWSCIADSTDPQKLELHINANSRASVTMPDFRADVSPTGVVFSSPDKTARLTPWEVRGLLLDMSAASIASVVGSSSQVRSGGRHRLTGGSNNPGCDVINLAERRRGEST